MDILLSRVTQHAMNYAIRSGVTIATGYTIKQCGRLLQQTPKSEERAEIAQLQTRLEAKIRIISPAIDMIELISARGHTSLESAMSLTKEIRIGIQNLGTQLRLAAEEQDVLHRKSKHTRGREEAERALKQVIKAMKNLIEKIDDAVPLVNLAITTSGVNLSSKLATNVSPSRLLQASTFLTAADTAYAVRDEERVQVGPTFIVSLYMLFAGHASRAVDEAGIRGTTWKEVLHKAQVKLIRLPLDQCCKLPSDNLNGSSLRESIGGAEFAYQLVIVEDLDDDRVHTEAEENRPMEYEGVQFAGIRDVVPIHEISKLFYADTGKILNIRGDDEDNTPILLFKRDVNAVPPRRMLDHSPGRDGSDRNLATQSSPAADAKQQGTHWRLPADLDPEWMALEVFAMPDDFDDECEDDTPPVKRNRTSDSSLNGIFSALSFRHQSPNTDTAINANQAIRDLQAGSPREAGIKTSLSLLEMLIKLTALQQFRQESHLAIEDELLNFFLEESATAGSGGDKNRRQRLRQIAIKKVGFDPYDESPIKRRGEAYIRLSNTETTQTSDALLLDVPEHLRRYSRSDGQKTPLNAASSDELETRCLNVETPLLGHKTPLLTPSTAASLHRSPSPLSLENDPEQSQSLSESIEDKQRVDNSLDISLQ